MFVEDIMIRNVVCAGPDMSVREAARIMTDNHIGSIIVKSGDRVAGIVTDRNLLEAIAAEKEDENISDVMARWIVSIGPEETVEKAADIMIKNKIKRLPVMKDDRLLGIVTSTDIVAAWPSVPKEVKSLVKRGFSKMIKR